MKMGLLLRCCALIVQPGSRLSIQVFATLLGVATANVLAPYRVRSQCAVMTRLPQSYQAILDIRKVEDYCLNPLHPRGRHKARYSGRLSALTEATQRGCAVFCSKLYAPARPPRLAKTLGGPIGALMRCSGDKGRVL